MRPDSRLEQAIDVQMACSTSQRRPLDLLISEDRTRACGHEEEALVGCGEQVVRVGVCVRRRRRHRRASAFCAVGGLEAEDEVVHERVEEDTNANAT